MRLSGKVAIVTGGARGIGRSVIERFVAEGARVVAVDLAPPAVSYPEGVVNVEADISREEDWPRVVDAAVAAFDRVDVLVNNAGIMSLEPAHELELASWDRTIAVNQTGVFLGMRAVLPGMRQQRSGSIVNVSSIWGSVGAMNGLAYQASKAAVRNMTKSVALTYVSEGIRCNSVHPGTIDTPLVQAPEDIDLLRLVIAATPMKRPGRPEEIAAGILYLASDEASFVTGAELVIDGGYLAG